MFLARYTSSGIPAILDLDSEEFFDYLEEALEQFQEEKRMPVRVILSGIEK